MGNKAYAKFEDPQIQAAVRSAVMEIMYAYPNDPGEQQQQVMMKVVPKIQDILHDEMKEYGFNRSNFNTGVSKIRDLSMNDPDMNRKATILSNAMQGQFV